MEYRFKSSLVIFTLATLAQYSTQDSPTASTNPSEPTKNSVVIEVFYEGNSLESKKFISEQLIPTNKLLSEFMEIKLVPFAQGHVSETNKNGTIDYTVSCEDDTKSHCIEDKVHTCAIHNLVNEKNKVLEFVNCTMYQDEANIKSSIKNCGSEVKLTQSDIDLISSCYDSPKTVVDFLKQDENARNGIDIKSVPTVFIGQNKTEEIASLAKSDLKKAVCQSIPDPKPSQCSGADAIIAGMLPLLIGAYYFIKLF